MAVSETALKFEECDVLPNDERGTTIAWRMRDDGNLTAHGI